MKAFFHRLSARFRQPKWRHGKLGALLTASFLVICILLNISVKALEDRFGWRRDLSFNGYATTGAETQKILDRLERDIELYLLYANGDIDAQLLELLKRYEVLSDRITVLETDLAKNPGIISSFPGDLQKAPAAGSVIVNCPSTGRYRILDYSDFFVQGFDMQSEQFRLEGLAYEKNLTEAISFTAADSVPTIGILQGHGELSETQLSMMLDFLKSNHFESIPIDLRAGDDLETVDLLLIASPQKDLTKPETEQIALFAENGGNLFITRDFADPVFDMPQYLSLLRSYGVVPLEGVAVASTEDRGSYHQEPLAIIPYMERLDMTLSLLEGDMDILLMPAPCAFETPEDSDKALSTATLLKSGPHAYLRSLKDGLTTIDRQEGDKTGELSLALFSHRMYANGNVSRLFACGSSAMFTGASMYQSTYVEAFLMMLMDQLLPEQNLSLDIMASSALRPSLTVGSQTVGAALIPLVPLLITILGLVILLPRRNR